MYVGLPCIIHNAHTSEIKHARAGVAADGKRSAELTVAASTSEFAVDDAAMERMELRHGRIARESKRHITLLRDGDNEPHDFLRKDVEERITGDADTGEFASWDKNC